MGHRLPVGAAQGRARRAVPARRELWLPRLLDHRLAQLPSARHPHPACGAHPAGLPPAARRDWLRVCRGRRAVGHGQGGAAAAAGLCGSHRRWHARRRWRHDPRAHFHRAGISARGDCRQLDADGALHVVGHCRPVHHLWHDRHGVCAFLRPLRRRSRRHRRHSGRRRAHAQDRTRLHHCLFPRLYAIRLGPADGEYGQRAAARDWHHGVPARVRSRGQGRECRLSELRPGC
mmetsp:Transcript_36229/g.116353  ORF Transcript_36229/g.116353 Transcript_36229/m.116353 type:complete len:232 (+) Transcript_36229:1137-1832(+)